LTTGASCQELCQLRISSDEPVSLLTAVAAVEADCDGVTSPTEYPPQTSSVLPAAQQNDEIRFGLHTACIPGGAALTVSMRLLIVRISQLALAEILTHKLCLGIEPDTTTSAGRQTRHEPRGCSSGADRMDVAYLESRRRTTRRPTDIRARSARVLVRERSVFTDSGTAA
jgi:hypothetical protein